MSQVLQTYSLTAPGFQGLNTQESPLDLSLGYALVAQNAIIDQYGRIGSRKGYAKVNLYPIPDGAYTIKFALTVPQATLSSDATVVAVADTLVAQNAYARALVERGEDGGLSSSEAYQLYKAMLSDYIALEGTRYPENQEFVAV